jgi:hypothetical protein
LKLSFDVNKKTISLIAFNLPMQAAQTPDSKLVSFLDMVSWQNCIHTVAVLSNSSYHTQKTDDAFFSLKIKNQLKLFT